MSAWQKLPDDRDDELSAFYSHEKLIEARRRERRRFDLTLVLVVAGLALLTYWIYFHAP